jgi:hypothetical protein
MNLGTELTDKNIASLDLLTAEALNSSSLTGTVTTIP